MATLVSQMKGWDQRRQMAGSLKDRPSHASCSVQRQLWVNILSNQEENNTCPIVRHPISLLGEAYGFELEPWPSLACGDYVANNGLLPQGNMKVCYIFKIHSC